MMDAAMGSDSDLQETKDIVLKKLGRNVYPKPSLSRTWARRHQNGQIAPLMIG